MRADRVFSDASHGRLREVVRGAGRVVAAVVAVLAVLVGVMVVLAERPEPGGVRVDGRWFSRADGTPLFWLADTAWDLTSSPTAAEYLADRADQGFTVVRAALVQAGDGRAFRGHLGALDLSEGGYWDHVDSLVAEAESQGLTLALAPIASAQVGSLLTESNARDYGSFLAARYGDAPVVWLTDDDGSHPEIWSELTEGLREGGTTPIQRRESDSRARESDAGAERDGATGNGAARSGAAGEVTGTATGSCADSATRAQARASGRESGEPVVDATPPQVGEDCGAAGTTSAHDVRAESWRATLGGATGTTSAGSGTTDAAGDQLGVLRRVLESRPYRLLEPADEALGGSGLEGDARVSAAVASDGSFLVAYTPEGMDVTVDLDMLEAEAVTASWVDPRTGEVLEVPEPVEATGTAAFEAPAGTGDERDWVLVLDDAAAGYGAPGSEILDDPGPAEPAESAAPEPAAPEPAAPEPAAPEPAVQPAAADGTWDRLAQCESSGDWDISTGNGYYGGLQFSQATWEDFGGTTHAPRADAATKEQQIEIATKVRDQRGGYGSWPACARKLGLPR